jgi:hypothetical protein
MAIHDHRYPESFLLKKWSPPQSLMNTKLMAMAKIATPKATQESRAKMSKYIDGFAVYLGRIEFAQIRPQLYPEL